MTIGKWEDPYTMVNGKWMLKSDPAVQTAALQNQLLQSEIDSIAQEEERQNQQGQVASQLASQFLSKWNAELENVKGYYNQATEGLAKAWGIVDQGNEAVGEFDDIYNDVKTSWEQYKTSFAPLKDESISAARSDLSNRGKIIGNLMGLATADYEGEAGRAKADVAAETERGRRAAERESAGLGINPASRNYSESIRKTRVQEALNKVLAGNSARLAEKGRMVAANKTAADAISQGVSNSPANIAQGIATGEQGYANTLTGIKTNKIGAISDLAKTGGSLASTAAGIGGSYADAIAAPMGELYAGNLGVALENNPSAAAESSGISMPSNFSTGKINSRINIGSGIKLNY